METRSGIIEAEDYYTSINNEEVQSSFRSLDDPDCIDYLLNAAQSSERENFVLDFSDRAAYCAFDLAQDSFAALLDAERPAALSTRWVNIWRPFQHSAVIELLARRYDFSPRLLALMCSDPKAPRHSQSRTTLSKSTQKRGWGRRSPASSAPAENEYFIDQDELSAHSTISSKDSSFQGNLYKIVDDIWHYSSIDLGRSYICVGYNTLYGTKTQTSSSATTSSATTEDSPLPDVTRIWTWLILCENSTVITLHEDPFPFSHPTALSHLQLRILSTTRQNLLNVFRSLSTLHSIPLLSHNPFALLPIRTRLGCTPSETAHRPSDAPGLLFYYLFENWHNSYTLVVRKESRYGSELASLRREMFAQPRLHHIDRLDGLGKELNVLKRHYESYVRLIDRILEPQLPTAASLNNSQVVGSSADSRLSLDTVRPVVLEKDSLLGVALSSAPRARFGRLRDLIRSYALEEVEGYLKEKEGLVAMNFSLISIRQSQSVDRLTRVTLLLTKATILFLPVSFMTGFFSVPLSDSHQDGYTMQTFWVCFAVIFALSWLALFLFGAFSGNLQTGEVVRGIINGFVALGRMIRKARERGR
ncbi:unnamed protein product [Zymoseptoria tritici ST99CH_3D1]|uniref:ADP-ribosylation factor n=3 Tax=Zymoseptoria tritici TaxID=1047171 RepID=F9X1I6_ZYMTI|nr:uncharacterized protein MYCGRDRAFT_34052 [Zymoseptoria tritici IPO323]EGP91748.1 hypothetical protein MYCGRDRAFT_34052 [Zymoseptoria tritici IPO323]SMQ46911.1 unnamed protein product [Zymoseptoria tritici ST99CH_3D7]SMR43274.1 unnamed protein product [Zymoseptoria tritici ST99CH_1E4]SMR45438.1 unnamed protein product [Zymoseptoria tritici ST99CH_3D1]